MSLALEVVVDKPLKGHETGDKEMETSEGASQACHVSELNERMASKN
jgi:hypothetical protein